MKAAYIGDGFSYSFPRSAKKSMWLVITFLASLALCMPAASQDAGMTAGASPPGENKPQPIPFSHKLHAQFVEDCSFCHEMPEPGWFMGYPSEEKCMQCHMAIKSDSPWTKKLVEYHKEKKPIPWVRIYGMPDYVYFSHKVHIKRGRVDCQACHGPIADRDVVTEEKPTSMAACLDCHKDRGAPVRCNTCHNPHP